MTPVIASVNIIPAAAPELTPAAAASTPAGSEFAGALASAIQGVDGVQRESAQTVEKFLTGENQEVHTTVLAVQRAELTFDLFLQVRNKMVSAYQEIMRMQI